MTKLMKPECRPPTRLDEYARKITFGVSRNSSLLSGKWIGFMMDRLIVAGGSRHA
jgi:hypothetical protein